MENNVHISEVPIEAVYTVHDSIPEFDKGKLRSHFRTRTEGKDVVIIGGSIGKTLVGYMISYDRDSDGSIYCWMAGVNPDYRRRGVLKALMDYQEKWAKEKGYKKIKIKTRNNRKAMLAYLISYGFYLTEVVQHPKIEDNRILLEKEI